MLFTVKLTFLGHKGLQL